MTKKKKPTTHVAIVLDRSGSMFHIARQAVDYYNEQRTQAIENTKDQNITLSLVTFNKNVFEHDWLADPKTLAEADRDSYRPSGSTAWYDALGYTIDKLRETTNEEEDTAYLVISISDGEENDSTHYGNCHDTSVIHSLIKDCEGSGKWTFSYMGCSKANLEEVARNVGISLSNMALWDASNAHAAKAGFDQETVAKGAYYTARTRGVKATSHLYSNSNCAADFTKQPASSGIDLTTPLPESASPLPDIDPNYRDNIKPINVTKRPFVNQLADKTNTRSLDSGTEVKWSK